MQPLTAFVCCSWFLLLCSQRALYFETHSAIHIRSSWAPITGDSIKPRGNNIKADSTGMAHSLTHHINYLVLSVYCSKPRLPPHSCGHTFQCSVPCREVILPAYLSWICFAFCKMFSLFPSCHAKRRPWSEIATSWARDPLAGDRGAKWLLLDKTQKWLHGGAYLPQSGSRALHAHSLYPWWHGINEAPEQASPQARSAYLA